MRISNRACRLLGYCLIATVLPLTTLFAQEKEVDLTPFLEKATEEIPNQSKTQLAHQANPPNNGVRQDLQNITEEISDQPKPRFVSSKANSDGNFKIQLGYFKKKKNVNKMVDKIKNNHDWSVYVKTENNNGVDYYRVMIVDITNQRAANEIMGQLKSEGLKAILR